MQISDIRSYLLKSANLDRRRLRKYRRMLNQNPSGVIKRKEHKKRNRTEYVIKLPTDKEYHYAGKDKYKLILSIQNRRLAEEMVKILENNISIKELLCRKLKNSDVPYVTQQLPKSYRPDPKLAGTVDDRRRNRKIPQSENPHMREELKLETSFGLFVRTKGEALIAELLYSLGVKFYYERTLELNVNRVDKDGKPFMMKKKYFPDFTIILPDDSKIYWEHKGMLSRMSYVESNNQKEVDYNQNMIYQPHNLIVTAEGPHNEIDMEGIRRIVDGWLMPLLAI